MSSKAQIFIHSTMRGDCVVGGRDDARRYVLFAYSHDIEYYVSKCAHMAGWNRWIPRISNMIVNDYVASGGKAMDLRMAQLPGSGKRKKKISEKQMGLI